jgi:hypothetical protein
VRTLQRLRLACKLERLAYVLTGRTGRDLRYSLNAARTNLLCKSGCHLPIIGLHASASLRGSQTAHRRSPIFIPRRCAARAGHLLSAYEQNHDRT